MRQDVNGEHIPARGKGQEDGSLGGHINSIITTAIQIHSHFHNTMTRQRRYGESVVPAPWFIETLPLTQLR